MKPLRVSSGVVLLCAAVSAQVQWSASNPASRPAPRDQFALVQSQSLGHMLLFGGELASGYSGETWLFDGAGWQQSHAPGPTARAGMAAAFDTIRSEVVLFSGWNGTGYESDTWVYEFGRDIWRNVTPPVQPPLREGARAVYIPGRAEVLLFGGRSRNAATTIVFDDTWSWNGVSWNQYLPRYRPLPRYGHSMVFYPAATPSGTGVLLFGGEVQGGVSNELWSWDGFTWSRVSTTKVPPARSFASMAYDYLRGRVVLFGGLVGGVPANDVWEFDGVDWQMRSPSSGSPPPRARSEMQHYRSNGTNIAFGGSTGAGKIGDTWEYGPVTPARSASFGSSCFGISTSTPYLLCDWLSWVGDEYRISIRAAPGRSAIFFIGLSDQRTSWGATLPLSLANAGIPCMLYVDPMFSGSIPLTSTTAVVSISVPPQQSLVGVTLYSQAGRFDPFATGGFVMSNACRHVLGGR
ncbi:MAG: hypothetical protein IPM29_30030 [Planctomycetes bacterium]|nr:hypothetical protein [Planctomycetota bacterium]